VVCPYPRPQLVREHWMSLNGAWRFIFDEERKFRQPSDISEWPLEILVPFPPESQSGGIGDRGFHPDCGYERDLHIKAEGDGRSYVSKIRWTPHLEEFSIGFEARVIDGDEMLDEIHLLHGLALGQYPARGARR
jgi:hypothetical protein